MTNLVLAENFNYDFDTSDFGLAINPIVSGSINGTTFSFTDVGRILLGHEEGSGDGGSDETPLYGVLRTVQCTPVPEPSTLLLLGTWLVGLAGCAHRRRAA